MSSLYDIKKKIEILTLFKKATNAMKLVALSHYHKLKKVISSYRKEFIFNADIVKNFFTFLPPKKIIHIFFGSNRGFCGDYNGLMANHFSIVHEKNKFSKNVFYFILGKMLSNKINCVIDNETIFYQKSSTFDQISSSIEYFYAFFLARNIDTVVFHYTVSEGFSKREIKTIPVVINPELCEFSDIARSTDEENSGLYLREKFLHYYYFSLFTYLYYETLFTENGIRFITMDASLRNADESLLAVQKIYFKERQRKINAELGDLIGSLL